MASILDKYKTGGTVEKKKSIVLNKYREQPEYGYSQGDPNATPYRPNEVVDEPDRSFLDKAVDVTKSVGRGLADFKTKFEDSTSFGLSPYLDKKIYNSGIFPDKIAQSQLNNMQRAESSVGGKIGEFAGYVAPGVGIDKAIVGLGGKALGKLSPVVGGLVRGSAAGTIETAAQEAGDVAFRGGKFDPLNVAAGTVLGGGVGAIGGGLSKALQTWAKRNNIPEEQAQLLLPEPRQRGNANGSVTDDVIYAQETGPRGLPEPNLSNPTIARAERGNPYKAKYEELIKRAQQSEFTPGREYEELQEMWGRMAGREDPALDDLIKMAYPQSKVKPGMASKAKESQRLREVSGVSGPVKSIDDRYSQNIGVSASPVTKIGFNPSVKQAKSILDTPEIKSNSTLPKEGQPTRKDITEEVDNLAKQLDSFDPTDIKDLGGFSAQTRDVYRNLEATMGPNAKPYIEGFDLAKKDNVDMQEYWTKRLKTEVVDKLGITKGSKLSGLVQQFGEKRITEDELKKLAPDNWQKVVEADKWFRESYDNLIDIVNESRMKVYPNNPEKIVPKRNDYYRHFKDMEGMEGLKNLFETPAQISPGLSGLSEFVKPKTKFAGFMQKRGLGSFKDDAVGGFLEYVPSASYSTKIDPQIEVFRSLAKALADTTDESRNVNGLIEYLQDYANNLAGKTNPMDRFVQKVVGRKTMGVVRWVNNRVKTNTILGNVGSLLAQLGNVPNGIAATKQHAVKGAGETMASMLNRDNALVNQSPWLKERYYNIREFDTRWFEQPKKLAAWAIETADRVGTEFIWNSAHAQGVAQKVADPIAYADDLTRKMVAGRGVGEQPLIQGSTVFQVLAPFTLEVANAWRVMGDFVKAKDVGAIATLFVGSYMFNKLAEETRGSGVVFDPIDAMVDAFGEGLSPTERVGRVAGEVLSNVPFGDKLASIYPEYGMTAFGQELPTREQAFGDNDPTRFGGGLTAVKGIQDPLYKLIPPLGGNQIKKTIQGVKAIANEGYEKDDKLRFPIERTPTEIGKAIAFGPNGTSAGREYYGNDRRPLSEKQTESYYLLPKDQRDAAYVDLMRNRLENNAKRIMNDENLTEKERKQKIAALQKKFDELKD